MIGIFMLALCVGAAMGNGHAVGSGSNGYLYACPPSTNDERAFREFADLDRGPKLIPSLATALEKLSDASPQIKNVVSVDHVKEALVTQVNQDRTISPFIQYCCPAARDYDCTSVVIPIWWVSYGSNGFCWVVYPNASNPVYRHKCTCVRCVYKDHVCPLIGRCVETNWKWRFMVIYCPLTNRYFAIYMIVPCQCRCRPYCPWWVPNQFQLPNGG